jgi:hypothetical protein
VLGEAYVPEGSSMGVESFLDKIFTPYFNARFCSVRKEHVLFVLDPACFQRSQIDEVTIAQSVNSRGFKCIRANTNDPERRIAAVEGLLTRAIDGGPGILFSPAAPWLIKAMDWGYRNKKQLNGQITATPEKNHYSHISDALQYACLHYNTQMHPATAMFQAQALPIRQVRYRYA